MRTTDIYSMVSSPALWGPNPGRMSNRMPDIMPSQGDCQSFWESVGAVRLALYGTAADRNALTERERGRMLDRMFCHIGMPDRMP